MTDAVAIALAASAAPTLMALAALVSSILNRGEIKDVHKTVNSQSDKRTSEAEQSGSLRGRIEEKEAQQSRADIQHSAPSAMAASQASPAKVEVVNAPDAPVPIKPVKP